MSQSERYFQRFSRNIGILSLDEQKRLSTTTVGVAGLGGLGGQTFINLVRMGVGKFVITDLDTFDIANTNRQIGASENSLGKSKVSVMAAMAKDINPDVEIREIPVGVLKENVEDFVNSSDVVVDSLDFFCLTPRRLLYSACEAQGKTVILSAPLGFSATLHAFSPGSMTANDFFGWTESMDKFELMLRFAIGIAPSGLHLKYLQFDKEKLAEMGTGPSISFSCGLGAALLSAEVLFFLLRRRPLYMAPTYTQLDLFRGKYVRRKLIWGNRGPLQKLKIFFGQRHYESIKNKLSVHIK